MIDTDLAIPLRLTASGDIVTVSGRDSALEWCRRTIAAEAGATPFWPSWGVGAEIALGAPEPAARASLAAKIRSQLLADERISAVQIGIQSPGSGRIVVSATVTLASGEIAPVTYEVE